MSAILTALRSPTITCLRLTYDGLPKDAKRIVDQMNNVLDGRDNHATYKAIMKESNTPPCIPWLDAHLHDVFCEGKDIVETQSVPMINFAMWTRFHDRMKEVSRHKPPDVSKYRQTKAGALAYLEEQLRGIAARPITNHRLEELSRKLWQQERLMHRQGFPALETVGMK